MNPIFLSGRVSTDNILHIHPIEIVVIAWFKGTQSMITISFAALIFAFGAPLIRSSILNMQESSKIVKILKILGCVQGRFLFLIKS